MIKLFHNLEKNWKALKFGKVWKLGFWCSHLTGVCLIKRYGRKREFQPKAHPSQSTGGLPHATQWVSGVCLHPTTSLGREAGTYAPTCASLKCGKFLGFFTSKWHSTLNRLKIVKIIANIVTIAKFWNISNIINIHMYLSGRFNQS